MTNWADIAAAVAAVASLLGIFVTLFTTAKAMGQMTERLLESRKDIGEHAIRLDGHDRRLNSHDVDIARLQEWKDGYNAAARLSGKEPLT